MMTFGPLSLAFYIYAMFNDFLMGIFGYQKVPATKMVNGLY